MCVSGVISGVSLPATEGRCGRKRDSVQVHFTPVSLPASTGESTITHSLTHSLLHLYYSHHYTCGTLVTGAR